MIHRPSSPAAKMNDSRNWPKGRREPRWFRLRGSLFGFDLCRRRRCCCRHLSRSRSILVRRTPLEPRNVCRTRALEAHLRYAGNEHCNKGLAPCRLVLPAACHLAPAIPNGSAREQASAFEESAETAHHLPRRPPDPTPRSVSVGRSASGEPGSGEPQVASATGSPPALLRARRKPAAGLDLISAVRRLSRTKSCIRLCCRNRTSVFAGCTFTSTSSAATPETAAPPGSWSEESRSDMPQ